MAKEIEIRLVVPANSLRWLLTAALMLVCAGDTVSESVSLTTYYPAPSGIYTQMIATGNSWLARDATTNSSYLMVGSNGAAGNTGTGAANTRMVVMNGRVGIGTNSPSDLLHVAGNSRVSGGNLTVASAGSVIVGNSSAFQSDQGGSMELGGNNSTAGTGTPYVDFHFNGVSQDYNVRMINDGSGRLTVNGNLRASGGVGRGYVYIDNSGTGCWTAAVANGTICAGNFGTFTPGLYVEGWTYQNRGGAVTVTNNTRNTTKVWAQDPVTLAAGWFTIAKNDNPVTYYCCPK